MSVPQFLVFLSSQYSFITRLICAGASPGQKENTKAVPEGTKTQQKVARTESHRPHRTRQRGKCAHKGASVAMWSWGVRIFWKGRRQANSSWRSGGLLRVAGAGHSEFESRWQHQTSVSGRHFLWVPTQHRVLEGTIQLMSICIPSQDWGSWGGWPGCGAAQSKFELQLHGSYSASASGLPSGKICSFSGKRSTFFFFFLKAAEDQCRLETLPLS